MITNTETPYTDEQLAARIKAIRAIENLMGRHAFLTYYKRASEDFEKNWCSAAVIPTLTCNDKRYEGYTPVKTRLVHMGEAEVREGNSIMRGLYPGELGGKSESEIWGVGTAEVHTLTTPVIELAEDMKTAKAMWYSVGANTQVEPEKGPVAYWQWEKYAVDFIFEDGAWKIWHKTVCTDFKTPVGSNWAEVNDAPSGSYYKAYSPAVAPQDVPPVPRPYNTFSETFSY